MSLGFVSLAAGFTDLLPVRSKRAISDGAKIIDRLRNRIDPKIDRLAWLTGMEIDGIPTRSWDPTLISEIEVDFRDDSDASHANMMLFSYYLGVGNVSKARIAVERLLKGEYAKSNFVRIEYAFLVALMDRDGSRALQILNTLTDESSRKTFNFWRARATACHASGDVFGTLAAIGEAKALIKPRTCEPDDDDYALFDRLEREATMALAESAAFSSPMSNAYQPSVASVRTGTSTAS
jgi:hypothetical protein